MESDLSPPTAAEKTLSTAEPLEMVRRALRGLRYAKSSSLFKMGRDPSGSHGAPDACARANAEIVSHRL